MTTIYAQILNKLVHRSVNLVVGLYSFILAALMVIYSVEELYQYMTIDFIDVQWYTTLSYLFLFFGGVIILIDRNRNLLRSVGIYAIALGGYRFFTAAPHVHAGTPLGFVYLIICGLAINLLISGRSFIFLKVSRNRISLMISTLTLLLVYLSSIVFMIHAGFTIRECAEFMPGAFIACLMYAFYIGILDSEVLRASDALAIHNETLNKIRCTQYTDPESYMSPEAADVLSKAFEDRSDWTLVTDGGPVDREFRFRIKNVDGTSEVLVQKWNDSEKLYFTISDHLDGTLLQAYRFSATSICRFTDEFSHQWLRVFGRQGICMQLRVEEQLPTEVGQ